MYQKLDRFFAPCTCFYNTALECIWSFAVNMTILFRFFGHAGLLEYSTYCTIQYSQDLVWLFPISLHQCPHMDDKDRIPCLPSRKRIADLSTGAYIIRGVFILQVHALAGVVR